MLNTAKKLLVLAAALIVFASPAARRVDAQSGYNKPKPQSDKSQAPAGDGKDGALKLNSTVINISTLVSDRSGRYIPQLTKDDFEVFEDGVRQQVSFFGNEEVPFNVALLMDVSGSVSSSLKDIKKAAIEFVRQLRPNDRVMVVCFDQHIMYLTDFTNDRQRLESAINGVQTGHGTSIYDAVYDTVSVRFRGIEGRKAMLLLSDGEDNSSRRSYDETIARVAESDVLVYGIRYPEMSGRGGWGQHGNSPYPGRRRWPFAGTGFQGQYPGGQYPGGQYPGGQYPGGQYPGGQYPGGGGGRRGGQRGTYGRRGGESRDFMKDVTEAGGGPLYDAKSIGDLSKLAPKIADELRHVYVIGYYPTKPLSDGGYRSVDVKIKGRDDLAVRHRRGYDARQTASAPAS
jgi:Ca-activated chloride channel family protein